MNRCFHCKKTKEEHAGDNCLFEATTFREMTKEEGLVLLGSTGAALIRKHLQETGFARGIFSPKPETK